ncbi:MAG: hypothetical protein ACKVOL_05770 [Novosphingobium sp.]
MPRPLPLLFPLVALALTGCLAKTAVGIVTAPVRVGARAVDLATTSQSEADENRGRAMRKRDGKVKKLQREYNHRMDACNRGESAACADASRINGEIEDLRSR